jgi:MFS family permease
MFLLAFFTASVLLKNKEPVRIDSFGYLLKKDIKILKQIFSEHKQAVVLSIVSFSVLTSVSVFLPLILEQKGFNFLIIGVIIALSLSPIFIFETNLGEKIDKAGSLKSLLFALILLGFTTVILSLSFNLLVLIPMMFVFGFANTITFIAFTSLLSEWSDKDDRGLLSGIRKSLMSVGTAVGPIISGLLLVLMGVKMTMAFLAVICFVTASIFVLQKGNIFNKQTDLKKQDM